MRNSRPSADGASAWRTCRQQRNSGRACRRAFPLHMRADGRLRIGRNIDAAQSDYAAEPVAVKQRFEFLRVELFVMPDPRALRRSEAIDSAPGKQFIRCTG